MIGDTDINIRRNGIKHIIKARINNQFNHNRKFEKPIINFHANTYYELNNFDDIYEPILTFKYTNEELLMYGLMIFYQYNFNYILTLSSS